MNKDNKSFDIVLICDFVVFFDEINLIEIELEQGDICIWVVCQMLINVFVSMVVLMVVVLVFVLVEVFLMVFFVVVFVEIGVYFGVIIFLMVGIVYFLFELGVVVFVQVGDKVSEGQIIFIVEVMKIMNNILVIKFGIVKQIFVEDVQLVEFGELFIIVE